MNSICAFPNGMNIIIVCLNKLKTNKKYKETTMKEIVSTFCALLNSHGGRITLKLESGSANNIQSLKRVVEQRLSDILGFSAMRDHVTLVSPSSDELVFTVEEVSSLCTVNYNMHIPTELQILVIPPKTTTAAVKEVLSSEKRIVEVEELVEKGTHYKEFVFQQNISDHEPRESKTVCFKNVKDKKSKCVTLGDRMTNKSNKFANYVSAFANHNGGHIYYGVDDDGVVKGEVVKDKEVITKKVSKAINKMVWPTECGGPKRGQHWDILFEPVNDVNGDVIQSTFVIVVYVACCAGGVFTEEPESYHIVNGEVKKIEFEEWRRRLFLDMVPVPQNVTRAQWSTRKMESLINSLSEKMVCLKNSGGKEAFVRFVMQVEKTSPCSEVLLTILSQKAAFACRRNELDEAEKSIKEYSILLHKNNNENFLLFQVVEVVIKSTKERAATNYKKSYELATSGLQIIDFVPPGLYSAWLYLQAASLLTTLAFDRYCQDRIGKVALAKTFDEKALEHVSYVSDCSTIVTDIRQYIYIHLASLYLQCSLNGTIDVTADVPQDDITRAKNCLMMVDKLVCEGYSLSPLRQIHYFLTQSHLFLRHSQEQSTTTQQSRRFLLESSLRYSEKSLKLAIECHFGEMALYSRQQIACLTEEIVRDGVRNLRLKKSELVEES